VTEPLSPMSMESYTIRRLEMFIKYKFLYIFLLITISIGMFTPINTPARGIKVKIKASEKINAPIVEEVNLYGESYALVIGINDYTEGWPRLSGAVNDAKLVAKELSQKGFNVTLKTNLDSKTLKQTFEEFFILKGNDPQTRLFVWFAGHGHTLHGEGFLIPTDAPLPHKGAQFRLKALSMRRFGEYVRLAQSKHVLAVFDSCFSGTIFDTQRTAPPPAITRATTLPVRQFLTSGDTDQKVSDDGRFRKLFIRAIRDEERADYNQDGYVTGSELGLFLTDRVTNLTQCRQTPRYGKLRDEDYDRGDFVFLLASSGAVIEKPAPIPSKAYLSVDSNVSGAKVLVDGYIVGSTDLSNVEVSSGEHQIVIKKDGYKPYFKTIGFKKGRTRDLYVVLDLKTPLKGRLYVNTKPKDTRVRILNIVPKFYQGISLDAGRYHVEVSAEGHDKQKMWISLTAGQDKTLDIHLNRKGQYKAVASQGQKITNSLGMEFVYIAPGTFIMGSPSNEPGRGLDENQHRVTLTKGFYMQTTEVTQGQWKAVMGNNPSYFKNCGDDYPVEQVSWYDVQDFIRKLNQRESRDRYRLPSEAEWEYAARAGSTTAFANGGISEEGCGFDSNLDTMGWYCGNSRVSYSFCFDASGWGGPKCAGTHSVAQKQPNAWGLYDMHGNVSEWVQDLHGDYPSGALTDPTGPSSGSGHRMVRGGSWGYNASYCRSAHRYWYRPDHRQPMGSCLGFRLVKKIDLADKKVSSDVSAKKIGRDENFIADNNGTVIDTKTGLMWASKEYILSRQAQKDRLESFLRIYCRAYENKDLNRFTSLFTPDATENNTPFQDMLPNYRKNMKNIKLFKYRIELVDYSLQNDTGNIRINGKYFTRFLLHEGTWEEKSGSISMELITSGDSYMVKRLNYVK